MNTSQREAGWINIVRPQKRIIAEALRNIMGILSTGKLPKQLYACKHDQVSAIKYGIEPSSEKVSSSLKFKVTINDTAEMKLTGVSLSTELHLEKANKLRQV